jgi:hypothetical protein
MRTHTSLTRAGLLVSATVTATVTGSALVPGHGLAALVGTAPETVTVQAEPRTDTEREGERRAAGSSAYGLSLTGPIPIKPIPAVSSVSSEVRRTLLQENSTRHLTAKALETGAAGDRADAKVGDLRVPAAGLTADSITAECGANGAESRLVNARVAGERLASAPRPNTTIPVEIPGAGRGWVTLNKQQRLPDGRMSVTGLETTVPLGPLGQETLRTANVVCGRAVSQPDRPTGKNKPGAGDVTGKGAHGDQTPALAPRPSAVKGDLAVTG